MPSRHQLVAASDQVVAVPAPSDAPATATGGSAASRLLDILNLFSTETIVVRVEEVAARLGVGRSTAYRYLQELCDSGLLVQRGKGVYALGPRVLELERLLQLSDPLLNAGKTVMADVAGICENRTLLLCSLFKDKVVCTHQVGPSHIRYEGEDMPIYRGRGSSLALFQGAGSQAILAYLAPHQIRSLYLAREGEIAAAGMASTWKDFRGTLTAIRKQGYAATVGKRNPRVFALAVPVLSPADGPIVGSLLLLSPNTAAGHDEAMVLVPTLQAQAKRIGELEEAFRLRQMGE